MDSPPADEAAQEPSAPDAQPGTGGLTAARVLPFISKIVG